MLVQSPMLVVITKNADGTESKQVVRKYDILEKKKAEADAMALQPKLAPNQTAVIEYFLDSSKYQAGWDKGLIF